MDKYLKNQGLLNNVNTPVWQVIRLVGKENGYRITWDWFKYSIDDFAQQVYENLCDIGISCKRAFE